MSGKEKLARVRKSMSQPQTIFSVRSFLVEKKHPFFSICDELTHHSMKLRNALQRIVDNYYEEYGTYEINDYIASIIGLPEIYKSKWEFGKDWEISTYKGKKVYDQFVLYHLVKNTPEFRCGVNTGGLTRVLSQTSHEMKGWIEALQDYHESDDYRSKSKYRNVEPKKPGYKSDEKGRNVLSFPEKGVSRSLNKGALTLGKTGIVVPDYFPNQPIVELKICPNRNGYDIIVVYKKVGVIVPDLSASHDKYAGLDLGVVLLAMLACNDPNVRSAMIGAKIAVGLCRKMNYHISKLIGSLPRDVRESKAINRFLRNHNNRMKTFMHTVSKRIVEWCLTHKIGVLVVGTNNGWKQRTNMGRHNNRRFQKVPFQMLRDMLKYKCFNVGIAYIEQEESHTSKTSFVDDELICHHDNYAGRRVMRGLFRSNDGSVIHSDRNGALNILRKAFGSQIFSDDRQQYVKQQPHNVPLLKAVTS